MGCKWKCIVCLRYFYGMSMCGKGVISYIFVVVGICFYFLILNYFIWNLLKRYFKGDSSVYCKIVLEKEGGNSIFIVIMIRVCVF